MFKNIFGDIRKGRLLRLPYLGYSLLLLVLIFVFMISIGLMIGSAEQMMGGNLQQAQDQLRAQFTLPFIIIYLLIMIVFLFAGLNIMAKRIRDMGLPGWWTILGIFILSIVVIAFVSEQAGSVLNTVAWLALLLLPGETFNKATNRL